jgi:putative ABC transport system ATP-binding protein
VRPRLRPLASIEAITARGVEMVYVSGAEQVHALKDVSLDVHRGEMLLLSGPSGSGKTTLLSVLGGILTPTAGVVTFFGTELTQLSRSKLAYFRLRNIGFIFQGFNLFSALTALENVELGLSIKGVRGKAARARARELLEAVGLGDRVACRPRDLSGGEKQRVAIARALVGSPAVLIADEPTSSLDAASGHNVIELLRTLAKRNGATVLIATHDPRIEDVVDRVVRLDDGLVKTPAHAEPAATSPIAQTSE